jgi:hypothetical protein
LSSAKLGCTILGVYVGCIMYADDLLLLSASVSVLQAMINLCCDEIAYLDMALNVSKSFVILIGKRFKQVCAPLSVRNKTLVFTECVKYLGIHILSGAHFVTDIDKLKAMSKCGGFINEMVTIHLINSFCRPLLLHGCDGFFPCPSHVDNPEHSFNRIYWRLFKVNNIQCIADIHVNESPIYLRDIANRRFRCMRRASTNATIYFLANFVS